MFQIKSKMGQIKTLRKGNFLDEVEWKTLNLKRIILAPFKKPNFNLPLSKSFQMSNIKTFIIVQVKRVGRVT